MSEDNKNDDGGENKQVETESGETVSEKKHPWRTAILIILGIVYIIFVSVCVTRQIMLTSNKSSATEASSSSSTTTTVIPKLFTRSANNGDIIFDCELDFSSLGAKFTLTPQRDIDGLKIKINFLDDDESVLYTKYKTLGNVTKGVQVSFSISLFDLDIKTILKTEYATVSVSSGTVSYFS